jgi:hypothetical protein
MYWAVEMVAPDLIQQLVERYRDNSADYHAQTYKEFRLRKEFIDPFFECLGWDLANKSALAEAYKEVIHEDAIKVDGGSKAPDYAFRVGGTRKFFVETKAPNVNIKEDLGPAFQLRRYGWSAKLPLSVLTNFEGFAVYDCRIKPNKNDKAGTARILYIDFEQYSDRWSKIASKFSHDAVWKGSFDRYANDAAAKRGTTQVDEAFLADIEEWRSLLARNIELRNSEIAVSDLNPAV